MAKINISDARNRDAVVNGDSVRRHSAVYYTDTEGDYAQNHRILQGTTEQMLDGLKAKFGDDLAKVGQALIDGDPEVDIESFGSYLTELTRVYVDGDGEVCYRIEQFDIIRNPDRSVRERRPRERAEANTDGEFPLSWTGKLMKKDEAVRRFAFVGKLQVTHVNGLTYDFLYGMAKELHEAESLLLIGAGKKGNEPLIFRRGSVPYRGFLEGRIDGDRYALILHLTNQELKPPAEEETES